VGWPWRRGPVVYPAALWWRGNGDTKGRSPGRARISRKPLRGESRDVSAVPVKPVCALHYPLHTVLLAQSAPGLPCALCSREGQRDCRTRAKTGCGNNSAFPRKHRVRKALRGAFPLTRTKEELMVK